MVEIAPLGPGTAADGVPISTLGSTAAMRTSPEQQRGRDKVARILVAGERVLLREGYEATIATPEAILRESGVSKGSFYRYFRNSLEVLDAIAERYFVEARQIIDDGAGTRFAHWTDVRDRIIDDYADFYRHRAVRELWLNNRLTRQALDESFRVNRYVERRIGELLRDADEPVLITPVGLRVTVEIAEHVRRLAFADDPDGSPAVIAEAKRATRAYLGTFPPQR